MEYFIGTEAVKCSFEEACRRADEQKLQAFSELDGGVTVGTYIKLSLAKAWVFYASDQDEELT